MNADARAALSAGIAMAAIDDLRLKRQEIENTIARVLPYATSVEVIDGRAILTGQFANCDKGTMREIEALNRIRDGQSMSPLAFYMLRLIETGHTRKPPTKPLEPIFSEDDR